MHSKLLCQNAKQKYYWKQYQTDFILDDNPPPSRSIKRKTLKFTVITKFWNNIGLCIKNMRGGGRENKKLWLTEVIKTWFKHEHQFIKQQDSERILSLRGLKNNNKNEKEKLIFVVISLSSPSNHELWSTKWRSWGRQTFLSKWEREKEIFDSRISMMF